MANTKRRLGWDIEDIVECHSNGTSDYMGHHSVWDLVAHAELLGCRHCERWGRLDRILQLDVRVAMPLDYHSRNLL